MKTPGVAWNAKLFGIQIILKDAIKGLIAYFCVLSPWLQVYSMLLQAREGDWLQTYDQYMIHFSLSLYYLQASHLFRWFHSSILVVHKKIYIFKE